MTITIEDHGSIVLLSPLDAEARDWLDCSTGAEALWFGGRLVVEPRYLDHIVDGFTNDGGDVG